jgi:hypothetical protein
MVTDNASVFKDFVGTSEPHISPIHLHQQSTGSSTADDMPFSRDGLLTYREAEQPVSSCRTPLGSERLKTNEEEDLRKYIMKVCKMIYL